jgi:hypothetical protein
VAFDDATASDFGRPSVVQHSGNRPANGHDTDYLVVLAHANGKLETAR